MSHANWVSEVNIHGSALRKKIDLYEVFQGKEKTTVHSRTTTTTLILCAQEVDRTIHRPGPVETNFFDQWILASYQIQKYDNLKTRTNLRI